MRSQYMANYQEAMEKMRDLFASTAAAMPFIQEIKKTKINGAEALELTMDMSAMFKNMPNNPAATQMMQTMIGADETSTALSFRSTIRPLQSAMSTLITSRTIKAACQNPQASLAADAEILRTQQSFFRRVRRMGRLHQPNGLYGCRQRLHPRVAGHWRA